MATSAEIWILSRLSELSERCGLSPVDGEVDIYHYVSSNHGESHYLMSLIGEPDMFNTVEESSKFLKMKSLLGLDVEGGRRFQNLKEAAEVVDHALSLAPRARTR